MRRWLVAAALLLAGGALAQQAPRFGMAPLWPAPQQAVPQTGDMNAGRAVAVGGEREAGGSCVSCHGIDGAGDGSGAFPRLGGQPAWYLYRALQDYAAGQRPNAAMTPIARGLTDRQMQDVAAWFAAQAAPIPAAPTPAPRVTQMGAALHAVGAPDRGVAACSGCHGQRGEGGPPGVPALAGQYAGYTALQLRLWRHDARGPGAMAVMPGIAKGMTEEEIDAVALWFASLRAP